MTSRQSVLPFSEVYSAVPDAPPAALFRGGPVDRPLRWLVFGSKGWIGQQVMQILRQERPDDTVFEAQSRADNELDVDAEFNLRRPDRVLSLIGRTHGKVEDQDPGQAKGQADASDTSITTIDYLEQKGKLVENVRDNLYGPLVLLMMSHKYHTHLTHISTGCIYQYDDAHPLPSVNDQLDNSTPKGFTEQDNPNFFGSSYSVVKGFTDRIFRLTTDVLGRSSLDQSRCLSVRIRMPITSTRHPRNFITKITSYAKICSIENSMTVLPELLHVMLYLAIQGTTGTVNLSNPGTISHNRILELYREIVDPTFTWQNFTQAEQAQVLKADRSNNCLDTSLLQSLAPYVLPIEESVREVLIEMRRTDDHNKLVRVVSK